MKNVDMYMEAHNLAKALMDSTSPLDIEIAVPTKAKEFGLSAAEYQQFSADTRNIYGRLRQLAQMDAAVKPK